MYLATWLSHNKCSEMLFFFPLLSFQICLYSLYRFCLSFICYKPALCRQLNHPEAKRRLWMSFCIAGIRGRALAGLRPALGRGGFPGSSVSSRLSLGCYGFLGFSLNFHGSCRGKLWGEAWGNEHHWENKTVVTEYIKMLNRHSLYHYPSKDFFLVTVFLLFVHFLSMWETL